MSMIQTDEPIEKQPSNISNCYVKLIRLSKEDIERNTGRNHKKENTSTLVNQWNTPNVIIKQENVEDTMGIYETTIEHTSWQSTVQAYGINVKIEPTDVIEVKTEQENRIRTINESSTAFPNYIENANQNEFICQICHGNFDNYEEYIIHTNLIHKSKPFICKVCNANFVLNAHLNIHLAEHVDKVCMLNSSISPSEIQSSSKSNLTINPNRNSKNSKLAKKYCSTSISINVSNNFTQNLSVTDPNTSLQKNKCKAFKCVNCVFATASETKFLNHHAICNNTSKGSSKFFQCNLCIKTFTTRSGLNGHLKYHTFRSEMISRRQLALNKRKLKNQIKNSNIKYHKYVFPKIANFNRSHKCKDCNKHFTTRSKLNIHYKQHKQQMICNICDKKFLLKKNFEKHLLSHTNGISNDTSFNESNSLQNQNAIKSTGDKSENQIISKHEKLFHCAYCNNSYKSQQSLSQHNRQHHSRFKLPRRKLKSKTVECNWCSLIITKCNLLRHIKSLHPNINPIQCSHCPMAFKDSPSLKLHVSRCHTA